MWATAENNKKTEQKTVECLVRGITIYSKPDEISFTYLTLNNSSTLNDMIEALGKPNGTIGSYAVTVRKQSDSNALYTFCYHYKGNVMITVEMNYFSKDNISLDKITVS